MLTSCPHSKGGDSLVCGFACALPIGWQVAKKRKVDKSMPQQLSKEELSDLSSKLIMSLSYYLRPPDKYDFRIPYPKDIFFKHVLDNLDYINIDENGQSPLIFAMLYINNWLGFSDKAEQVEKAFDVFKWLLSKKVGASPYVAFKYNNKYYVPLMYCIDASIQFLVEYLINEVGIDVNTWRAGGRYERMINDINENSFNTPLYFSIEKENPDATSLLLKHRKIIPFINGKHVFELINPDFSDSSGLQQNPDDFYVGRWCTKKILRHLELTLSPQLYQIVKYKARRFWDGFLSGREDYSQLPVAIKLGVFGDDENLINEIKTMVSVIRRRKNNPAMRGFPLEMYNTIMRDVVEISSKILAI